MNPEIKSKIDQLGDSAVEVAATIFVEKTKRLANDDFFDVRELISSLMDKTEPDEIEAIRVALCEILDNRPIGLHRVMQLTGRKNYELFRRLATFGCDRKKFLAALDAEPHEVIIDGLDSEAASHPSPIPHSTKESIPPHP